MLHTKSEVLYSGFGLKVQSDIPLPELPIVKKEGQEDLSIEYNDLTQLWDQLGAPEGLFIVKENFVMFHVPNTAIFSIQYGNKILVSPSLGAKEDKIRLYILGTCMGAILMQRGILPLHGSVIAINGKAYAFIGKSGAGKSTLATAFLQKGYQLLSDDVIAVTLDENQKPYVIPSYPQQKLWQESLTEFEMKSVDYQPLFERETKYAVPVSSQFYADPLPIEGIIELVKTRNDQVTLSQIERLERFRTLYVHTFRHSFIQGMGLMNWHFTFSTKMLNEVSLFRLQRPTSAFTAHELVEKVLHNIEERIK